MFLRIETFPETKLIGTSVEMSLANNRTGELWRGFMPRRKEISNAISNDLFSMQVYDASYNFKSFDLNATFKKYATTAVKDFNAIPPGMVTFTITQGLYAVFLHKGLPTEGERTFRYIFSEWIPASGYEVDTRPHFEILGSKYSNTSPDSEEEIFIPIIKKQ